MKKIVLAIFALSGTSLLHAKAYWCPANIVCSGVEVVTCQKGNFSDVWRLDDQSYTNVLDPYFRHVGATYDANTGIARCTYVNSSSQGLGLTSAIGPLQPFFQVGLNWKWSDATKLWASCIGHEECPFKN